MNEEVVRHKRTRRRGRLFLLVITRTVRALFSFFSGKIEQDIALIWRNGRLFTGTALVLLGFLTFSSDVYCDGASTVAHYSCTRPTTYYYYSLWSLISILLGSFLIILWYLRKHKT